MIDLPRIRVKRGDIGNEIWIKTPDISDQAKTYISADVAAAAVAFTVLSPANFASNTYVVIGEPGAEDTELRLITVTGSSFGVAALTFPHTRGTVVRFIPFNQIELYSATAVGGTYSLVGSAFSIRVDALETFTSVAADAATKAYKVRFKNAQDSTYSDYSDEVIGSGYADNTVYSIKRRAMIGLGEKYSEVITDELLDSELWTARRDLDALNKRWSFRTTFNSDIGTVSEGAYTVSVPATLRNPDSPQNILGLRIGKDGGNIRYVDKKTWDSYYEGVKHTTVATQPTVGQTTLVLTDAADFDDSGSILIGDNAITYTGKSTNTLTGIPASGDGSIDDTHAAGTNVWQNASFGTPRFYTVFEDKIYFNCPFEDAIDGSNIFMDFYNMLPVKDSDSDVLDEPDYDMYVSYLKWVIKSRKSKGALKAETDSDYLEWIRRRKAFVDRETLNQDVRIVPDIEHLEGEE